MGFYLRKSVKVGPLRFNLSKSGLGVSVGIRGLRFGAGPRGNYVHMGTHGIYYRATIPSASRPLTTRPSSTTRPTVIQPEIPAGTHAPLEEIESADATQIIDSSSADLLQELNAKRRRVSLWPLAAALTALLALAGLGAAPDQVPPK
jgi:hypothetical protein